MIKPRLRWLVASSRQSIAGDFLEPVSHHSSYVPAATDTSLAISNTISELYPILNFIGDPSAQGTEADFERAYCQDNDASRSRLLEVISRSVHRLTHDDTLFGRTLLDLPPMEVKVVPVHFNKIERIMYDLFAGRLRELAKA